MELKKYIPADKLDVAAIDRARLVGFPTLNPILPDLLAWVQDANWPVAQKTASFLSQADAQIIPHIKLILNSDDDIWKLWTVQLVIKFLRADVSTGLRDDLTRLAIHPTNGEQSEEVDLAALSVLTTLESSNLADL